MENTILKKPELYNRLYSDVTEDIIFYKKILKDYKEVVEYGAGTGRITIPLALENKRIFAIDNEIKMLENMEQVISSKYNSIKENIVTINADMITYVHPNPINCVILPLTVFNYIIKKEDQIKCLSNIAKYIKKGGIVVIELLTKETFHGVNDKEYQYVKKIMLEDGNYYEYWRKTSLNNDSRLMMQSRLFKYYDINNKYVSEECFDWKNCFISFDEIKDELNICGFKIKEAYGNCSFEKYYDDSEDLFIVAEKL